LGNFTGNFPRLGNAGGGRRNYFVRCGGGEDFQNGFVDVCDTPYPETIAAIREVGYKLYELRRGN